MPELQFILKVASRCNLACTYCYVYAKGDESWRGRPTFMSDEVFEATLARIRAHVQRSGQASVRITFHGGEPTAVGRPRFDRWCRSLRAGLEDVCDVELSMQTNGVLIDEEWRDLIARHRVSIGLSIDGPRAVHDRSRVDHAGRGSHDQAVRGLRRLVQAGVPVQILCVVQPGVDGLATHRHLSSLGARGINYLLPDHTHDTVRGVRAEHGPTPCADYLLPVLEEWWLNGSNDVRVTPFWNMSRLVLGGDGRIDVFGHTAYQYVFVEADGSIEGLDVLRICGGGLSGTGLSVLRDDFIAIAETSPLHRRVMFDVMPTPTPCHGCAEESTCGGGYLPHRFEAGTGLDHRSVWCADLLLLFGRLRELLGVKTDETQMRREALAWLHLPDGVLIDG